MRSLKYFIVALLFISFGLVVTTTTSSNSKEEMILANMENVGKTLSSFTASLWQQKTNTQIGISDPPEMGTIYYVPAKNGKMKLRIDIQKPAKTVVVSGNEVKFYQKDINQLLITSTKGASSNKSVSFLAITFGSVSAMRENYNIKYVKDEKIEGEMTSVLHLTPKTEGNPYKSVDVWISQSIWMPLQQKLIEVNEDVTLVRLSNLKKNIEFDVKTLIDNFNPKAKVVKG
ncbi:MAG: outer membrane lipoprotein carrier protein LolA [Blastocatellia bacterium]|nr:outer membrane lipoprotein carrier protein LolA [Blastocatellia bacterium]